MAGEDPGPVDEPPDEGGGEEREADGRDPVDPHHHQPRLQPLLTEHRDKRVNKSFAAPWEVGGSDDSYNPGGDAEDGEEEAEQLHLVHKVRFLGNCQKVREQTVPMATKADELWLK